MIGIIWSLINRNPLARWLAKIGGLVLLVLTFGAYQRNKGAQWQKEKQAEVALEKTVKGQEDARKGRAEATEQLAKGKTPEEVRRQNDGKW